jgi:hypothetical protein
MLLRNIRRLEKLEEANLYRTIETINHSLEGRSVEDAEFFCVHGYLPEVPISGRAYKPQHLSWKEWKEDQRITAGRTTEEREFFCAHGYWPPQKDDKDDNA